MKAIIEIEIIPFSTPNYVRAKVLKGEEALNDTAIHLRDLSPETLLRMCSDFKDKIFDKAGKQQPTSSA